jgi:DNA-binding NarL/FixJ family response regulator
MSTSTPKSARIFLVDDQAMVRQGLATVLAQAGFTICGQAGQIQEAMTAPALASAQLAILDLSVGEDSGLDLIRHLRARGLSSLVYSMHEDSNIVRNAFAAGALGYVSKREAASCLLEAVGCALAGRRYVSPRTGISLVSNPAESPTTGPLSEFSERQQRVYELLGVGLGPNEIAKTLNISPRTVESYAARMIEKLDVSGMRELRRRAIADRHRPTL